MKSPESRHTKRQPEPSINKTKDMSNSPVELGQEQIADLRSNMRLMEQKHAGAPVMTSDLQAVLDNVHDLYSAFFRLPVKVPLEIHYSPFRAPVENEVMNSIPRALFARENYFVPSKDRKRATDVKFGGERIMLYFGKPELVNPTNTLGVFRTIIAHEYSHAQTRPVSLIGENAILRPRDIGYGGEVHKLAGFQVSVFDPKLGEIKAVTEFLEEYTAQYLAMVLYDSFGQKDSALKGYEAVGIGISAYYITAGDYLKEIFDSLGIKPSEVEDFHFKSDLRGFIQFLNRKFPELGKKLLKVGMDKDLKSSIEKLRQVKELILSRK